MRITSLFACILAGSLLFSACKKSDSDALPTNYRIDGVQDVNLAQQGTNIPITGYMSLSIMPTGKIQEHVALSIEGMPDGCSARLTSSSGFPAFSTNIIFTDSNANGGTYPVKLVCDGSVTGKKSYTFNLTLPQLPDCSSWLLGSYTASNSCTGGSYTEYISAGTSRNKIVFNNFEGLGMPLYGIASCQTSGNTSITIPSQTINGITFSGYGYASSSYFYISYNRYPPGSGSTSCTLYLY
jgi:hypothetical protein